MYGTCHTNDINSTQCGGKERQSINVVKEVLPSLLAVCQCCDSFIHNSNVWSPLFDLAEVFQTFGCGFAAVSVPEVIVHVLPTFLLWNRNGLPHIWIWNTFLHRGVYGQLSNFKMPVSSSSHFTTTMLVNWHAIFLLSWHVLLGSSHLIQKTLD